MRGGDDIGGSLFDYAEAIELQLTEDGGFAGAWSAGQDESFHWKRAVLANADLPTDGIDEFLRVVAYARLEDEFHMDDLRAQSGFV